MSVVPGAVEYDSFHAKDRRRYRDRYAVSRCGIESKRLSIRRHAVSRGRRAIQLDSQRRAVAGRTVDSITAKGVVRSGPIPGRVGSKSPAGIMVEVSEKVAAAGPAADDTEESAPSGEIDICDVHDMSDTT